MGGLQHANPLLPRRLNSINLPDGENSSAVRQPFPPFTRRKTGEISRFAGARRPLGPLRPHRHERVRRPAAFAIRSDKRPPGSPQRSQGPPAANVGTSGRAAIARLDPCFRVVFCAQQAGARSRHPCRARRAIVTIASRCPRIPGEYTRVAQLPNWRSTPLFDETAGSNAHGGQKREKSAFCAASQHPCAPQCSGGGGRD
jgi:hypothetical protein